MKQTRKFVTELYDIPNLDPLLLLNMLSVPNFLIVKAFRFFGTFTSTRSFLGIHRRHVVRVWACLFHLHITSPANFNAIFFFFFAVVGHEGKLECRSILVGVHISCGKQTAIKTITFHFSQSTCIVYFNTFV
ncbi:hypothetical protein TRVL_06663 [Trypanosoma vivax]|nr:hypothetical protein TRVL_06663 [Trypanosoma vivax]